MKQADEKRSAALVAADPRRVLWWLDSLIGLAVAATLTALLLPAGPAEAVNKHVDPQNEAKVATTGMKELPTPLHCQNDVQYFPSGHEFILQNEADFLNSQNAPPAPPGATVDRRPAGEPPQR